MTGSGILGLMEALVEIGVFTVFESLICLKYTGKILDLLSQNSQSYEWFNDIPITEYLAEFSTHSATNASMLKSIWCTYVISY